MPITLATPSDIPALCELLEVLFTQEAEFQPDRRVQGRGLADIIGNPQAGHILVARRDGQVVGMVGLLYTISTALGGRVAWMEDLVVASPARNAGLGSQLLRRALECARDNGCLRVTLLTDRDNLPAQRFYQRHGFNLSAMIPMRLSLGD
jgi:GNAT superfamily N-acetyltransferase